MSGTRETACSRCAHSEVCALKDQFLSAQNAVNNVTVFLSSDNDGQHMIELQNLSFINPVELSCKFYMSQNVGVRDSGGLRI